MKNTTTETRPALSFDGFGINGPDIYRARIATFTDANEGKKWGPMFAASPVLLTALADCITEPGAMAERSHEYALRRLAAISELARAALACARNS